MPDSRTGSSGETQLGGGKFFGVVRQRVVHSGAVFSDLRHTIPRRLPAHSHELPFFGLLLDGQYGERYGQQNKQFGPFSFLFRPAGVPHQDEIGPGGVHFFHFELQSDWKARIGDCSGNLDLPCEDGRGGRLVWLALKLMRETLGAETPDALCVESLLAETVGLTARLPFEERIEPPPWMRRVLDKLVAEHCSRLRLDELSAEAGVHPVHLSRVFRRFQKEGIGEYVHRLRARTASTYLMNPEISIADVSFSTGFSDQSHFTRAFRKITGMTPQAFRASMTRAIRSSALWGRTSAK